MLGYSWLPVAGGLLLALPSHAGSCPPGVRHSASEAAACIDAESLWHDLHAFQVIADAHPDAQGHGNRDTGTPGYKASVDHVAKLMLAAGYSVTVQPYDLPVSELTQRPVFTAPGHAFTYQRDWFVARLTGSGDVTAPVTPVGGGPGCAAADFAAFPRGAIALLPAASCEADRQIANAQAAGAAAAVFFNDAAGAGLVARGGHGDGSAYELRLHAPASIPVIGAISAGARAALLAQAAPQARISVRATHKTVTDYNLIADSPYGEPDHVVVIEAHLDSIYGAGMLDNASGSVSILDTALALAQTRTKNRLRYIWFGGEELGLFGSRHYVGHLGADDLRRIVFDVDADVTATPNFDVLIADPADATDAAKFPPNVIPQSRRGNAAFLRYFATAGIASEPAWFGNDGTDSISFARAGIPDTGVLTNQDCCKMPREVKMWGGFLGNYEGKVPGHNGGCVDWPHRWCDNLGNNNQFVLTFMSKAIAYVTYQLADDGALDK